MRIHKLVFLSLAAGSVATAWWGCAEQVTGSTTETTGGNGGAGGSGGSGGLDIDEDAGTTTDGGSCVSTSEKAERVPLDIIFLIDRSGSMTGLKWIGTTSALTKFFNDPQSAKIGVGLSYFPTFKPEVCDFNSYKTPDVPIGALPFNTFALTNSMPADATGGHTPTHTALKGTLMAATAYQDAHPTHKVVVVLATDGDPTVCEPLSINSIADLAESARNYNGVRTFVIAVEGSNVPNLDKIAEAGGTGKAYDITTDISLFTAKMNEIRNVALGCEFEIPLPPNGKELDPDEVNFSYTPGGMGDPKVLLRADDLFDCKGQPGWYYNNNKAPTKIVLCPASCATVEADAEAEVNVLFGCKSQVN